MKSSSPTTELDSSMMVAKPRHSLDKDARADEYCEKMVKLSNKMNTLHDGLDQERNKRFEHLQIRLRNMDESMSASEAYGAKKFNVVKDHLIKFQGELVDEFQTGNKFAEEEIQKVGAAQKDLEDTLEDERKCRTEMEARVLSDFEAKTRALKFDIDNEGSGKHNSHFKLRRYLEQDVPKLYEGLKEEQQNREAMEHRMLEKAMEEVDHLHGVVVAEKKAREDTEEAMLRMMEDVVAKMHAEVNMEREERSRTQQMLVALLDETCRKLQIASQSL